MPNRERPARGSDGPAAEPGLRSLLTPKNLAAAVVVVLLVLFIVLNRDRTEVSFIVFSADVALWIALAVAALAGLVVGFVLGRRRYRR